MKLHKITFIAHFTFVITRLSGCSGFFTILTRRKEYFFSEDESLLMRSLFINECILYFSWEWGFSHLGCQPNRFYNLMNLNRKIWNFHLESSWIIATNLPRVRLAPCEICHIYAAQSMKFHKIDLRPFCLDDVL